MMRLLRLHITKSVKKEKTKENQIDLDLAEMEFTLPS